MKTKMMTTKMVKDKDDENKMMKTKMNDEDGKMVKDEDDEE